ncbi:MAG: hypothetical protein ABSG67_11670 [Thermoguttaceae bacterium]
MSSVGPLGGVNVSAAGAPLAQTKGSDVERAGHDIGAQHRNAVYEQKAEAAAGIGETDGEDHQTDERDADGRHPWELPPKKQKSAEDPSKQPPQSRDTTGASGNLLDLTG